MIQLESVCFNRSKFSLGPINLSLEAGNFWILLGPNGSGKSTLLKLLSAELEADKGQVFFQGHNIKSYDVKSLAKKRVVLSQFNPIAFPLRVYDVVAMGRYPYNHGLLQSQDHQLIEEQLKKVELWHKKNDLIQHLSGGEQQRAHFARVLCQIKTPETLILLDEPLASLDYKYQKLFLDEVYRLSRQGHCVFCILHDVSLASHYADHIVCLKNGKMLKSGSKEEVLSTNTLESLYDLPFRENSMMHFL